MKYHCYLHSLHNVFVDMVYHVMMINVKFRIVSFECQSSRTELVSVKAPAVHHMLETIFEKNEIHLCPVGMHDIELN